VPRVDVETILLCDVLADGTVAGVALVEPVYETTNGARVGTRTVDPVTGAAYTPQGTLRPCQPDTCTASTSTQVLCDIAADGTATPFLRATTYDCDGALLATLDRTLDGAVYTVTGTVGVCPVAPDCEQPTTPTATVGLCLPDGTPIAVTVVRDCEGVVTSEGWINLLTGAWSAGAPPVGTVACGDSQSVQVSGTFCDLDAAGEVVGLVLIEYSYAADGTIDGVRLVDATTGATYTPTGTISVCPAGVEQPEQDVVQLCDTAADGTVTQFIRDYRRDELGAITGHSDYTLDGAAYTPTGTVGVCPAPCLKCETIELCDSAPVCAPDTMVADADWSPHYLSAGDSANPAVVAMRKDVPGGGSGFWGGGSTVFPNLAADGDGGNDGVHYGIAGVVQAANFCPACIGPEDQVVITASGQATNDGPGGGIFTDGRWRILRDGGEANGAVPQLAQVTDSGRAPGTTWSFTASATVPWSDVLAGRIVLTLDLETRSNGSYKQWTASGFEVCITPATPQPGCGNTFRRTICRDCAGEIVSTTDYEVDGVTPYTPVGEVGECITCTPPGAEACQHCETLLLCDGGADDPATITGLAASGTLSNGVAWTATNPGTTGQPMPARYTNADGAWWGLHTFPNPTVAPTKWTFSQPSFAEFSVYLHFNATTPAMNSAQLPAGLQVVSLPDGYAYNPATGVLTRTADGNPPDPCSYVTDPQAQTSARFRTASPVDSFTLTPPPNSRIALCGTFFTWWAGAITVEPTGQFLRTICRGCDGEVTSVTDTDLDGVTPYTPLGTVGTCQPKDCCQPVQVCVDATRTESREFISNAANATDNSVDPTWEWSPSLAGPWYDMYRTPPVAGWTTQDGGTAAGTAHWVSAHPNGSPVQSNPPRAGEGPTIGVQSWYARAVFDLPAEADPASIRIAATVLNADQNLVEWRLNSGAWQPVGADHTEPPFTFGPTAVPGVQPGTNEMILHIQETVAGGGGAALMVHLIASYQLPDGQRSWTRMVCCDDTVYYIDDEGVRRDTLPEFWSVAPCAGGGASGSTCAKTVVERCGCDDTDGDGIGDVQYTELWAVDPCGGEDPLLLGTFLDGDLTQPYTPTAPVECTAAEALPGPLSTGIRNVTGTAVQNLAASFPGLQSVSLTVLSGTVNVTMTDGAAVPVPAGATMTWSVAQEADTALVVASFAGATTAANYLLNWTYR
jgi:hypothetical protein